MFSRSAAGNWFAYVEIISEPSQQVVVDNWGPLVLHRQSLIALATVHLEVTNEPVDPLVHSCNLVQLQPRYYFFAFNPNLAHCCTGDVTGPGIEEPPVARWSAVARNFNTGGGVVKDPIQRYFFVARTPDFKAAIIQGDDGKSYLRLRYRRLTGTEGINQSVQTSSNLVQWDDVTDSIDLVERTLDIDGTEFVVLCLRESLETSEHLYLRLSLDETE